MKKSNVIIFAALVLISAFLLWLWYYLGFNRVDNPLDLVLSIIWWLVVLIAIVVIIRLEKVRRRRIRTVYVGKGHAFNSEKGLFTIYSLTDTTTLQDSIASMLDSLKYDFTREDFPKPEDLEVLYFIRTKEFEAKERDEEQDAISGQDQENALYQNHVEPTKWTGEVVVAGSDDELTFDTPEELNRILATISSVA